MPRHNVSGYFVECHTCGKSFRTVPSRNGKYCSKVCCFSLTVEERFWKYTDRKPSNEECWNWIGGKDLDGYGKMGIKDQISNKIKHVRSTHVSWRIHRSLVPSGMHLLHKCDNPSCVNPNHLFLGTNRDNVRDKIAKGRMKVGNDHGASKITATDVVAMRNLRATQKLPYRVIGEMYGLKYSATYKALTGLTWKHT